MSRFRDAPINRKIMLVVVVTSTLALMLMAGTVIAYEVLTFRRNVTRHTTILARVVGSMSTSSLAFENAKDAEEVLSVLSGAPNITAAAIYDHNGLLFAQYPSGAVGIPVAPTAPGTTFDASHLEIVEPILEDDDRLGMIYLRADLRQMYNRLLAYGLLVIAAGLVAVGAAIALSALLQRFISRPVSELARTARAVSERQDYSVRAVRRGRDEIGDLTDAFNQMLTRIGEATSALAESEERRRLALEGSETGTWDFNLVSRHITWDGYMLRLFGMESPNWHGSEAEMYAVIHPEDRARVERSVQEAIEKRHDLKTDFRVNAADGTVRHVATRGGLFYDAEGNPIRMSGVSMDVTAAKATEQALENAKKAAEAANRAKDEFLAILSHELRTPLSPVLATLAMLDEDSTMPATLRRELEMIRRNVEVEARLIDDLLDVTRIARGKLELVRQTLDVRTLLEHAVRNYLKDPAAQKNLVTEVDIDPAATTHIHGDASRITQVLWNLLQNATKFTPAGGSIRIRVFNEPAADEARRGQLDLVITISDTGIGIDPQIMPRLFNAFEQGDPSRTRTFGGLGLGLAICRAIVGLHGGSLTAASAGRNSGSTFTIRLPTVPAPLGEAPAAINAHADSSSQPRAAHHVRILLVEDHLDTAQQLTRLLERAGHQVTYAQSLAEARALASKGSFDLLLSDLGLPDGSGHELMREFAASYGIAGIALSGYGMEEDVRQSLAAGFARHLTKPVNWPELKATIQVIAAAAAATNQGTA